jgi:hypothetical protein
VSPRQYRITDRITDRLRLVGGGNSAGKGAGKLLGRVPQPISFVRPVRSGYDAWSRRRTSWLRIGTARTESECINE